MSSETIKITVKLTTRNNFEIDIARDWTVLKVKEACSEISNIPVAQQRLIYKGKILKDDEKISNFDIQNGHAMHLVQSQTASSSTAAPTRPNPTTPTNVTQQSGAANTGNTPVMNSGMGSTQPTPNPFFNMAGFNNPFGNSGSGSGMNQGEMPDMSQFMSMFGNMGNGGAQNLMNNPMISNIMNEMLSNPEITRQIMTPEFLQAGQQMAMEFIQRNPSQFMTQAFGQAASNNNNNNNNPPTPGQQTQGTPNQMQFYGFDFFNMMPMANNNNNNNNPSNSNTPNNNTPNNNTPNNNTPNNNTPNNNTNTANTTNNTDTNTDNSSNSGASTNRNTQPPNPFVSAFDPNVMQNVMRQFSQNPQLMNNIMGAMSNMNFGQPNDGSNNDGQGYNNTNNMAFDTRRFVRMGEAMNNNQPPEERYSNQLRSLQEMGFIDSAANIQALQESGGDVNTAITRLLERGMGN